MPEYHWIVVVQFANNIGGSSTSYTEGIITPDPWQTRQEVFRLVRDLAIAGTEGPGLTNPIPVFFSLERNTLR